jgi:hypothetical protein
MEKNSSQTKCPKCESTSFEIVKDCPNNTILTLSYLRCASCKTFLGLTSVENILARLDEIKYELKKL